MKYINHTVMVGMAVAMASIGGAQAADFFPETEAPLTREAVDALGGGETVARLSTTDPVLIIDDMIFPPIIPTYERLKAPLMTWA